MHNNIMAAVLTLQRIDTTPGCSCKQRIPQQFPEQQQSEKLMNMTPENKAHFESEKEVLHLILTGIGDEYTHLLLPCQTAQKCGKLIEGYNKVNTQYSRCQDKLALGVWRIANQFTPPSESASEEDSDPEQAQKDKDMQKNLALIAKYFKKLYKPTNNNLRTSSNTRNKNVDTTPRYKNDNQTGQFGNQRAVNVVGARETECKKPKRVKDSTYHKEKMLLCKQAEKGVQLQAEQSDWLADTDEEIDKQKLEEKSSNIISYALIWKPCQGDSLNLPNHRIHKDGDGDASFQLKSDSLPHAHAQTTKTFYKQQDSRIMKAQKN
ncbi:hypothetical protein Tco_0246833 [Tanacetum coccineum]